jgi:hypothetical protein
VPRSRLHPEANSGNNLSGHAAKIKDDVFEREAVAKSERGDDHDQASAESNHHVGADAGGPEKPLALKSDHAAQ